MNPRNVRTVILVSVTACLMGACATGMKGSARRQCYDAGLQPGTQAFEQCWQGIAARDTAQALATAGEVAVGIGAANSAPNSPVSSGYSKTYQLSQEWFAPSGDRMCRYENGTVLNVGPNSCYASIR